MSIEDLSNIANYDGVLPYTNAHNSNPVYPKKRNGPAPSTLSKSAQAIRKKKNQQRSKSRKKNRSWYENEKSASRV